jgi:AcrR family transcriptional regulator
MTHKTARGVRERGPCATPGRPSVSEPRRGPASRRTKGRLRGAIASLIHEKAYDAIAVKEILARADVGRSAFYTHFRDKEALLASALRATIHTAPLAATSPHDPADAVLAFSLPFVQHVERARAARNRRVRPRRARRRPRVAHRRHVSARLELVGRARRHARPASDRGGVPRARAPCAGRAIRRALRCPGRVIADRAHVASWRAVPVPRNHMGAEGG